MAKQDRYWVYTRDPDGEIIDNIGFFQTLPDALEAAVQEMAGLADKELLGGTFIHVVDQQLAGTTVWIAGPGQSIKEPIGYMVEEGVWRA